MSLVAGPVIEHPSPNFGDRRDGLTPELVVLHYTVLPASEALERLCDPVHEVSAHYLIAADGRLYRLVAEEMRAWHAGAGIWAGQGDVNSRSIGIELENSGLHPFSEPQIARLELLLSDILKRWDIGANGVIGHQDFAPSRKVDPGPRFDWHRLALGGLSTWPTPGEPAAPDAVRFLDDAAAFGYPAEEGLDPVLAAVRARFRPFAHGPLNPDDMALAAGLALDRGAGVA